MNEVQPAMTLEQATARANDLRIRANQLLEGAVMHYNRDSVKFNNQEIGLEAFLQELICIERSIIEGFKLHGQYVDLFEAWTQNVANREQIAQEIQSNNNQLVRFMGIVRNNIEYAQQHLSGE